MAWNLPSLPSTGTIATVANWATKVIDSLRFLKGLDGTVTLEDGLDLGANELTINAIEIVGVDGEVNKIAVEDHTHVDADNCGTIDHGALTGRGDDDHTAYQVKTLLSARGDIIYASGASTWARLAKGSAGYFLKQGADDPEWAAAIATKEFFARAINQTQPVFTGLFGVLIDGSGDSGAVIFLVPQDFSSLISVEAVFIPAATGGDMKFDIKTYWGAEGEAYNIHNESEDAINIGATTNNQHLFFNISGWLDVAAMAAGDIVTVLFQYKSTAIASNAYFRGVRFKYS